MPSHFRVIKLRHSPRHPTQVKAHAVFRRQQIQFFGHIVYMHYWAESCQVFFRKNVLTRPSGYTNGRRLNEGDLLVWNRFVSKLGWNDFARPVLDEAKK